MLDLGTYEMFHLRERVSQVFNRAYKDHALDPEVEHTGSLHVLEYTSHTGGHPRGAPFQSVRFAFVQRNADGQYRLVSAVFKRLHPWKPETETKMVTKGPWSDTLPEVQ